MKYATATPYTASYVIFKKGNQVCLVRRKNTGWMDGFYGLPAGKVEKKESFSQAAIREAKEEVGVDVAPDALKFLHVTHRSAEDEWVDVLFEATEWEGEPYNAEPHVHDEVAWFDIDNLPDNTIPAIKYYLEQITAGEPYGEFNWPK